MTAHPISTFALSRKAAAQDNIVARWTADAARRTKQGVDDALAHAQKALTDTLRNTPDGRPTIARVKQSRSFTAARDRLAETAIDLVMLVRDAREDFYTHEWDAWLKLMPDEWRAPGAGGGSGPPRIKVASLARVRNAALHGSRLETDIGAPVSRASINLQSALAVAAARDLGRSDSADVLRTWAKRATETISTAARIALRDSMTFADKMAGRDLLNPEWLDDDPSLPE